MIASVVVLQDDWLQTRIAAWNRFAGTAIGGVLAWLALLLPWPRSLSFLVAVSISVGLCYLIGIGGAGRLAAVTVAVIVLIPLNSSPLTTAFLRFSEVSFGIAVAVIWMWAQHRWFGDLTPPATPAKTA